jgi:threonine/homoserine/homoserine lactone efflux protein
MFWFSLLILMIVVAAAPGISMYIEARQGAAAGREGAEAQPSEGSQPIA